MEHWGGGANYWERWIQTEPNKKNLRIEELRWDLHVAEWSCLMLTTTQQGDNDKGKFNKKSILKFSFENVIIVLCDKSRHVNNLFVKYKTNDKSTQINLHTCEVVL